MMNVEYQPINPVLSFPADSYTEWFSQSNQVHQGGDMIWESL
jgi:hypothetical protein